MIQEEEGCLCKTYLDLKYTLKYSCTRFQLIRFLVFFFLIRVSFHTIKWCYKTIIWQTFLNLYISFTIYKKLLYTMIYKY